MIGEILLKKLIVSMAEIELLQQDMAQMIAEAESGEDPAIASRKSIEPSSRIRKPNEVIQEDKSLQFISDKINDAFSKVVD